MLISSVCSPDDVIRKTSLLPSTYLCEFLLLITYLAALPALSRLLFTLCRQIGGKSSMFVLRDAKVSILEVEIGCYLHHLRGFIED